MKQIGKGTIVTIIKSVYVDYQGGKYADHFVNKKVHYVANEFPSNNGNFKARNLNGTTWLNVSDVIAIT